MKELYTSPEAKLLCFAPVENLASEISADLLFSGLTPGVSGNPSLDIDTPA